MDITQLLKQDHQEVEALFEQLDRAPDRQTKAAIADRIFRALDIHGRIEEAIFYPDLEPSHPLRQKLSDASEGHAHMKDLITQLEAVGPSAGEFDELMRELKETVENHVDEEEAELFPAARDLLGEELLAQAGTEALQMKETLGLPATLPHQPPM